MSRRPNFKSRVGSSAGARAGACAAVLAFLVAAGALPAAAPESPLGLLEISAKKKGWKARVYSASSDGESQ